MVGEAVECFLKQIPRFECFKASHKAFPFYCTGDYLIFKDPAATAPPDNCPREDLNVMQVVSIEIPDSRLLVVLAPLLWRGGEPSGRQKINEHHFCSTL